jgi:hypothetical protein
MTRTGNPFEPQPGDPFGSPTGQPGTGYPRGISGDWPFGQNPYQPPTQQHYNTFAVLSAIFAVVVPLAGVVLGHLALPQIRRTGERGRWAAIWGLIIGYLLCVALIAGGIAWATFGRHGAAPSTAASSTTTMAVPARPLPPSVVTSVAPPSVPPRVKLNLAQVPIGTCAEVQLHGGESDDSLDLFGVPCEHRDGVYTVIARVTNESDCHSTYIAAPPDRSFALCLNLY